MYIRKTFLSLSKTFNGLTCRTLSTTTTPAAATASLKELDSLHQGLKFAQVPHRHLLEMEGPDSAKFLQGLITNHMPLISAGGDGFYTAFLTPQGRTLYDAFVYPVNVGENFPHQKYILDFSSIDGRSLLKHLKLYMLRSKIKIKDVTNDYSLYHLWGAALPPKPSPEVAAPTGSLIQKKSRWSDIGCVDPRVPGFGYRAVIPKDHDINAMLPSNEYSELPSDEYTIRRLLQGIPEGPEDIWPQQSLPLESNIDYMNGVDFRKGCYVGQELTIRTYHTGVVRKRIVPVQFYKEGESVPDSQFVDRNIQIPETYQSQADILLADGSSKRGVGKTCGGMHNIGLSLMRLEHVEKAVAGEPVAFKVANSDLLLRPFLPSWWPTT